MGELNGLVEARRKEIHQEALAVIYEAEKATVAVMTVTDSGQEELVVEIDEQVSELRALLEGEPEEDEIIEEAIKALRKVGPLFVWIRGRLILPGQLGITQQDAVSRRAAGRRLSVSSRR